MKHIDPASQDQTVCIIGLGYVGLTLAVTMAECGFQVIGVEKQEDVVHSLNNDEPHFFEPNLKQVLSRAKNFGRISFHESVPADASADVYIITVGTPLDVNGHVRLDMVESAVKAVALHARNGAMVIMRSTLKLGTTRRVVAPILDDAKIDYDLAFCPERTIEGHALSELRTLPQIVGGLTYRATLRAARLFQLITPTVVRVTNTDTAEMIKMVDNAQRDVAFAYSNEIARICDASGISGVEVIQAGKQGYPRTNLFMPGPVGGPCLSKDSHILAEGLREYGVEPEITLVARHLNERQPTEIANVLHKLLKEITSDRKISTIALLGLAFKGRPATNDLRGTTARAIFDAMRVLYPTAEYRGYDAIVSTAEIADLGLTPMSSIEDAYDSADLVMILNNHLVFELMDISVLAESMKTPGFIYDFWNHFDARTLLLPKGVGYAGLGAMAHAVMPDAGKGEV
jgi:UDP-N-acetyl-D-mannosaminuronic acid dehydrogenase